MCCVALTIVFQCKPLIARGVFGRFAHSVQSAASAVLYIIGPAEWFGSVTHIFVCRSYGIIARYVLSLVAQVLLIRRALAH